MKWSYFPRRFGPLFPWIGGVWNAKLHDFTWEIDGTMSAADQYVTKMDKIWWNTGTHLTIFSGWIFSALDCVCLDYSSPIYNTELQKWVESSGAFVAWNGHRDVVTRFTKNGSIFRPVSLGFSGKRHVELARIEGYVFFLCNAFGGWEGSMVRYSPWTNNLTRTPHKNSWPLVTPQLTIMRRQCVFSTSSSKVPPGHLPGLYRHWTELSHLELLLPQVSPLNEVREPGDSIHPESSNENIVPMQHLKLNLTVFWMMALSMTQRVSVKPERHKDDGKDVKRDPDTCPLDPFGQFQHLHVDQKTSVFYEERKTLCLVQDVNHLQTPIFSSKAWHSQPCRDSQHRITKTLVAIYHLSLGSMCFQWFWTTFDLS